MVTPILPGSVKDTRPLRKCSKCSGLTVPSAGTEVGPGRFWCRNCSSSRLINDRRKKK